MHKLVVCLSLSLLTALSSRVHGQAGSGFFYQLKARYNRRPSSTSYPRRVKLDTLYILNGHPTTDTEYVRRVLTQDAILADTLISGRLNREGKLEMVIQYQPQPKAPEPN